MDHRKDTICDRREFQKDKRPILSIKWSKDWSDEISTQKTGFCFYTNDILQEDSRHWIAAKYGQFNYPTCEEEICLNNNLFGHTLGKKLGRELLLGQKVREPILFGNSIAKNLIGMHI
jgi:hypothetical protein